MEIYELETDEKDENLNENAKIIYSEKFQEITEKQSFSYFVGGTVLLYRNIFRFFNIDHPRSFINKVVAVDNFISYKSPLLSKKSEKFRTIFLDTFFSKQKLSSSNFKNEIKSNIIVRFSKFFSEFSSYYTSEDIAELILEHLPFNKEEFNSFFMKNCHKFYVDYSNYYNNDNKHLYERNALIHYAVKLMVEDYLFKIDDIDLVMSDFYDLYLKFKLINEDNIDYMNIVKKNKNSKFDKIINFHYKKHFGDHIENMIKVRQYNCYMDIGEETIKNISYFKKANLLLNQNIKYNNMIEKNIDSYHKVLNEYPNLFHLSYSLFGFIGDDQLQKFKNLMKESLESKILKIKEKETEKLKKLKSKSQYYSINQESFYDCYFPLSNNGWKFLIRQNKSYALRFSRNLKLSMLCANLECHDAWLRASSLKKIVNNKILYYSAYNLIVKSIISHNSPVSRYTGFKNIYIYNDAERPNKTHLNVILNCVKNSILEIKEENISNVNMVNILFFLFDKLFYKNIKEVSEKYSNLYNVINEIKYKICHKDYNIESHNEDMVFYRNSDLKIFINEDNKYFILKKIKPFLKELETFLNYTLKKYYRTNFSAFNNIMKIYYSIEENNAYENYYEEETKCKYISLEHAIQRISDFINFNYINRLTEAQLKQIDNLDINKRLYINNNVMKNVKSLDHLYYLADKWHIKEEERKLAHINNSEFEINFLLSNADINENMFFDFEGFKFYPIKNSVSMYKEKIEMKHCIYQYTDYCIDKKYIAFKVIPSSINIFDKSFGSVRATLGCNRNPFNDKLSFDQTYSYCDADVSNKQKDISIKFIKYLNINTLKVDNSLEYEKEDVLTY